MDNKGKKPFDERSKGDHPIVNLSVLLKYSAETSTRPGCNIEQDRVDRSQCIK